MPTDRPSAVYRLVMFIAAPTVRRWGRLRVEGAELLDGPEPVVLLANHDSQWDPVVVGVAAPRRQIRALAKASLWSNRLVAAVLDGMGQIPIERGRADTAALTAAIDQLGNGACIGVFPEGTISRGTALRPLSGAGRLALAVPEARVVAAAITGAVDIVRFPKRPRITVTFFEPSAGQPQPGETAVALTRRVMGEVRACAPEAAAGRHPKPAAVPKE